MQEANPLQFGTLRNAGQQSGVMLSPAKLVGILAVSVFTVEYFIEAACALLPLRGDLGALLDSGLLTLLLVPILYLLMFRPLHAHISGLRWAHGELQRQRDELEREARLRSEQLSRSNAALRASFEEIDDFYQNAPFGYHAVDRDGIVVKMNDTELCWLGYTRSEIIGKKHMRDLLTPQSATRFGEQFAGVEEFGCLKEVEAEFVCKDGSILPVLVNVSAVRSEQGEFVMSRASVYDITKRKQAEREREQYFRFFNVSGDLMAISQRDGTLKKINQAFVGALGYSEAEILSTPYTDFIHRDDLQRTLDEVALLSQRGYTVDFENRYRCKDGSVRWFSWSAILDEEGHIYSTARDITEQKQYEEDLFNSNQMLERVFNTTHFCAAYLDRDFTFLRVNQAYAEACALSTEYFPGKNHFSLYPHEENEAIFRRVVDTGEKFTATAKSVWFPDHPEWGVTYWDWTLHPLKSPDGKVEALLYVLLDVTERQRADAALTQFTDELEAQVAARTAELRAKEQQLQQMLALNQNILTASDIGIAAYRRDGQCILANPSFAGIVGGTEEQLLAQNFYSLRSWQESGLENWAGQVFRTGAPIEREARFTTSFGREVWLKCHLSQFAGHGEPHLLLMFHDVREERLFARALQESEQRFKTLAAATFEGIAISCQGRLVDVNEQLKRMLGYERHELVGQPVLKLIAPEGREQAQAILEAGVETHVEHEVLCKDGSRLIVEAHGQTIDQNGARLRMTAIRDVTARVRAAAELRAAKADAERANNAKSRFLAAASHDLRQPLTALKLYAAALKLRLSVEDQEPLDKMGDCVASLSELLSKLLDFSKLEAGVVTPQRCDFSLDDMLHKVLAACGPQADAKDLTLRLGRTGVMLHTDPVLFQRIVNNLVHNAIRYTERGGVLITCRRQQGRRWIEVWDTGLGIPEHQRDEIFEEFRQVGGEASRQGSGLGLAIVARTANLLGLGLRVQSRSGRGSLFAVELPLGSGQPVAPQTPPWTLRRRQRVAVVDDDRAVLDAFVHALGSAGYMVTAAASGKELLAHADAGPPDILLCDYRLAHGETGYDVIAAARGAFGKSLPAILITGDTDPKLLRGMAEQDILILHKPVELEELQARIDEAMCERP